LLTEPKNIRALEVCQQRTCEKEMASAQFEENREVDAERINDEVVRLSTAHAFVEVKSLSKNRVNEYPLRICVKGE